MKSDRTSGVYMSWINDIINRTFKLTGEKYFFAPDFWAKDVSSYTFSGYALNEFILNGYRNPFVFMCIDKIADVASELPVNVSENGRELSTYPLFEKPNQQEKTFSDFYYKVVSFLLLTGNCFVYGVRPVGMSGFGELQLLNPKCVTINTVDGTEGGAVKNYQYSDQAKTLTIEPADMLHIKFPNIVTETNWGLSPLYSAIQVYESSNNIFEASAHLHKNRGISGILSNADSNMPMLPKEQEQLQNDMNRRISGTSNFGKMFVTTANLKWLQVGMSPEELKSLEGNLALLRNTCSIYGLDSSLFNDPDNKTYANRADAEKSMYTSVVRPVTDKINNSLGSFLGIEIETDFSGVGVLSRPNFELSQKLVAEVQAGIITAQEAKEKLYPND